MRSVECKTGRIWSEELEGSWMYIFSDADLHPAVWPNIDWQRHRTEHSCLVYPMGILADFAKPNIIHLANTTPRITLDQTRCGVADLGGQAERCSLLACVRF